jgi:histidyl-tRNA synthetase
MANKPSIPKGTRDFLPEQSLKRQFIFDTAKSVFLLYGYQSIETPAMENLDTLTGKYGEEGDKLIYKILDSGTKPNDHAQGLLELNDSNQDWLGFRNILKEVLQDTVDYVLRRIAENKKPESFYSEFTDKLKSSADFSGEFYRSKSCISAVALFSSFAERYFKEDLYIHGVSGGDDYTRHEFLQYVTNPDLLEIEFLSMSEKFANSFQVNSMLGSFYNTDRNEYYRGVSDKALRYDLTVPFARFVVQNQNELSFPFKRYQIQPVWRADRPQRGRYREFYQCDVDVIGSNSLLNEAELLCIVSDVFDKLGLGDISIRLNNRKILSGIANATGLGDYFSDMTIAIDKLDKIGVDGVRDEMIKRGLPQAGVKKALDHISRKANADTLLRMLSGSLTGELEGQKGIDEMRKTLKALPSHVRKKVSIDLALARGLNYYTGAIIEVGHEKFPSSICGGGRYDDLTGIFGLKNMSGAGVSFGADRIYDLMEDLDLFPNSLKAASDVLFINFGETESLECMSLAAGLRKDGYSAEVYPDAAKMQKQMKYADACGYRFVILIGSQELSEGKANVKDMSSGDQASVELRDLNKYVFDKLNPDD